MQTTPFSIPIISVQCAFVAVLLEADVQRDVGGSEWEETDEEEGTEEEGCEWLWICVTGRHWFTWWQTLMLHVSLCDYCSKQLYLLSEKAAVKRKRRLQLLITTTSWDSPLSVRSFWNNKKKLTKMKKGNKGIIYTLTYSQWETHFRDKNCPKCSMFSNC